MLNARQVGYMDILDFKFNWRRYDCHIYLLVHWSMLNIEDKMGQDDVCTMCSTKRINFVPFLRWLLWAIVPPWDLDNSCSVHDIVFSLSLLFVLGAHLLALRLQVLGNICRGAPLLERQNNRECALLWKNLCKDQHCRNTNNLNGFRYCCLLQMAFKCYNRFLVSKRSDKPALSLDNDFLFSSSGACVPCCPLPRRCFAKTAQPDLRH